jgi:trans-aconitate 2-methyltransferase
MSDWSASQYLKFEDERTRAARDLLAQVPLTKIRKAVDMGCGPGNSTELIAARYPDAQVEGVDSSPDMLRQAGERLPNCTFAQADLKSWMPEPDTDLLYANAVFQWVPNHTAVLKRLLEALPQGGVLAVQMPDNLSEPSHALMQETAGDPRWAGKLLEAAARRDVLPTVDAYYDLFRPLTARLDIWHTIYNHPMAGADGIIEWLKGTGLRPFLDPLSAEEKPAFLDLYKSKLEKAYPARVDGKVILRFPRLFILAQR